MTARWTIDPRGIKGLWWGPIDGDVTWHMSLFAVAASSESESPNAEAVAAYDALVGTVRDAELLPAALDLIRRLQDGWSYDSTDPEEGTWYRGISLDSYEHEQEEPMSDAERAVFDLLDKRDG